METQNALETIKVELAPTPELARFDSLYAETGDHLKEMCQLSYKIVNGDSERKKLFIEHIISLGMSRTSGIQLLKAGDMYAHNPKLLDMSHTNIVELYPVESASGGVLDDFYRETNTTPEIITKYSQKKLRSLVKFYLSEDEPTEDVEDEPTEDEPTEEIEVETYERLKELLNSTLELLENIDARYNADMEKEDLRLIHDTMAVIRKEVK